MTLLFEPSSSRVSSSASSVSFTSHSPRDLRGYYRLRGHPRTQGRKSRCHAKRYRTALDGDEESWTPRARVKILENATRRSRGNSPRLEGGDYKGVDRSDELRDLGIMRRNTSFRMRAPPRCTSHHHSSRNGNDTNGSTRLEGKPAESRPREQGERTGPQVGTDSVASGRYITCVLLAAVLNARDLLHLASSSRGSGGDPLIRKKKRSAIFSQEFLTDSTRLRDTDDHLTVVAKILLL